MPALSRSSLFLFSLLALHVHHAALADPEFTWVNPIGGANDDSPAIVVTDGNDDVIAAGSFAGTISFDAATSMTAAGDSDYYVAKYSPGGTLLWARQYGGTGAQFANAITVDGNGNIFVAGAFEEEISASGTILREADGSAFYAKLTGDGNPLWLRQTGGSNGVATAIDLDELGNVVLAGTIFGRDPAVFGSVSLIPTTDGAADGFVAKFSPDGSRLSWVQQLESDLNVLVSDVAVGSNIYVVGTANASVTVDGVLLASLPTVTLGSDFDGFVISLNARTGAHVGGELAGGRGIDSERGLSVTTDATGNALATGYLSGVIPEDDPWTRLPFAGGADVFLANHGPSAAHAWNELAGGPQSDQGRAVAVDESGIVLVGTFQGDWTLAGTPISAPPGPSSINSDMLVAHYTRDPAASRGWDWVLTAGSEEQDNPTAVAADSANDVVVSGGVGTSPAQFGALRMTGSGGTEAFVAKISEPTDPPLEDPYEDDPVLDREWELVPWRCMYLRATPDCPEVFRNNFIDYPTETIWTMRINGLAWVSQDDVDRFTIPLPEPAASEWGDRYDNISAAPFVDLDPADGLDDASGRPKEPLLECHSVEREAPGPDPRGVRTIRVSTGGRLTVVVIPSGADPIGLGGERVVISDGDTDLARDAAATDTSVSCPHTPLYDPREEPRPPNRAQLNLTVGERDGLRARSAIGSYDLLLTYRIEANRVGPPWVLDQMAAKGIRQLGGIFCAGRSGAGFPRCPAGPDGLSVIEFFHPQLDDIFNCFADGPGCWDIRYFDWPATEQAFDVVLSANEDISFTIFDEQQNLIANAAPTNLVHGVDTADPFTKQISLPQLAEGRYFLAIEGKPTVVTARFAVPEEIQQSTNGNLGELWWLAALVIVLIVAAVVALSRRALP